MTKGSNPILPSEPLSLEPDLLAVVSQESDNGHEASVSPTRLSPRRASKVRRRLDNRNYGRSESRSRSLPPRDYSAEGRKEPEDAVEATGMPPFSQRSADEADGFRESREGRSFSPRFNGSRDFARTRANGQRERSADYERERERPRGYARRSREREREPRTEPPPSRVLGIFGMSKFTNERNLEDIFGKYGPIEKLQIIRDPNDGRSRGYGFINMTNVADAQAARDAITGSIVHDRRVRVDFSFTNKPHASQPGRQRTHMQGPPGTRDEYYSSRHHDNRRYPGYGRGGASGDRGSPPHRYQAAPHGGYDQEPAPYAYRRRVNTYDRRRRDYPPRSGGRNYSGAPMPPSRGGRAGWARSRSPGFQPRGSAESSYRGASGGYEHHHHQQHPQQQQQQQHAPQSSYHQQQPPPLSSSSYHSHGGYEGDMRGGRDDMRGGRDDMRGREYMRSREYEGGGRPYAAGRSRSRPSRGDYRPPPATTRPPPSY
ncbi:hypothetical protein GGI07_003026 [Coemansia sp. Benny D115]|nr:hypothetical protein GGI07_003026 [Coemansia sp. Benny D115]